MVNDLEGIIMLTTPKENSHLVALISQISEGT
jgi:hypothetical protein